MVNRTLKFLLKQINFYSFNFILLVDMGSQRTVKKKSNFDKIKECVKLETTDNWVRNESFPADW